MMKPKVTTVPSAGFTSGKITWKKICHSLAPSMRAASSSSLGMAAINSLSTKMENAQPTTGMIMPR
ncbi:hypothetical protein D3C75_1228480 [compost metagenome]